MADARKFSRERHRIKLNRREEVESTLRSSINDILREEDPTAPPGAVDTIAALTASIASQLLAQPQSTQRALKTLGDDIHDYAAEFVEQMVRESKKDVHARIKRVTRSVSPPQEDLQLADDWAGPVAGPTVIERHYGIPRSTLHRWQKRSEVVWLNIRTSRKPVFPLRQFVDGRPADGIGDIVQAFGDPRAAWLWLITANPALDDTTPLERLLEQDRDGVFEALKKKGVGRSSS